jgi:hypothetical protein
VAFREFDGSARPFSIVAHDRDSQAVHFVHCPDLSIRQDNGLTDGRNMALIKEGELESQEMIGVI